MIENPEVSECFGPGAVFRDFYTTPAASEATGARGQRPIALRDKLGRGGSWSALGIFRRGLV